MKPRGTIYLIRPDWIGEDEDLEQAVVESYEPVRSYLQVAPELWGLAGDDERAAAIKALLGRVYERDDVVMVTAEIEALLGLLQGLQEALVGTVVDERWMVRPEQLPALRVRTKTLDLDESRGELAVHAVGEALYGVLWLQKILGEARDKGLWIALD